MNLEYVRLKKHFKKKLNGEDVSNDDIEIDKKINVVNDHIKYLFSLMDDEKYSEDSQIHTLKCLSKFIRYAHVKRFLVKKSKETKFENLKTEIRNLYEGKLDTTEIDETIELVRKDQEMREKLLKEMQLLE